VSDRVFLDTNVLVVYAYSEDDLLKQQQAITVTEVSECWISTQVLTEFVNVFHRKLRVPWPDIQVTLFEIVSGFRAHENSAATITQATRIAQRSVSPGSTL
jgi:predicted nucleic acid-binding protein